MSQSAFRRLASASSAWVGEAVGVGPEGGRGGRDERLAHAGAERGGVDEVGRARRVAVELQPQDALHGVGGRGRAEGLAEGAPHVLAGQEDVVQVVGRVEELGAVAEAAREEVEDRVGEGREVGRRGFSRGFVAGACLRVDLLLMTLRLLHGAGWLTPS
jgi:tetrahydromethanopterin S-methyltransferase subunit G